jgi:hypothetical protein
MFPEDSLEHDKTLDSCRISVGETLLGRESSRSDMTAVIPLITPYMSR